ncbi:MAG: hypothetical protein NTX24_01735 [Candidatus Pacearchaeota archaeon]|nr:hypothetical protein [Candidatus Pacearchaeota archaeon]
MLKNRKGQITLFIIIALVIIVAVLLTLIFLGKIKNPLEIAKKNEVEINFVNCVDQRVKEAIATAELQGGYLSLPDFESGSVNFPFSNYLNFLTLDVPYWFYVSGNGIQRVQKPNATEIEEQFGEYVKRWVPECAKFENFANAVDWEIAKGDVGDVQVKINNNNVETRVNLPLSVQSGSYKSTITEHKISTKTPFGSLLNTASDIFNAQNERTILENYSIDILNSYAPTNGFEITCAPKIWSKEQVQSDLKVALQENVAALKIRGSSYTLKNPENRYFVINIGKTVDEKVNFLYSRTWPTKIDIWPSSGGILRSDPLGTQAGLGAIGFCFVPYHFVYDLSFPVLIQVTSGTEMLQFPVVVIIDKMVPRQFDTNETIPIDIDICRAPGQIGTVFTSYNSEAVKATISFKCLSQSCAIGTTSTDGTKARLTTEFPRCVNGYLTVESEGFKPKEAVVSSNEPFILDMQMEPLYSLPVEMNLANNENAIIYFTSEDYSQTLFYPREKTVNLSEGTYKIDAQISRQGEISFGSGEVEKCIKIPSEGIGGILGMTSEQCYNVTLPSTKLTEILVGGGSMNYSFSDDQLRSARKMTIRPDTVDTPTTIDELSEVYDFINANNLVVSLS